MRLSPIHILIALAASSPAHAQAARWRDLADPVFRHIAQDGTLPNGAMPESLAQDSDGFIWVGTQNGLARWDGYQFRLYRADPGQPGALPDTDVNSLHRDQAGRLWVGTGSGGLAYYDPPHDRFVTIRLVPAASRAEAVIGGVSAIIDDGAGGAWAGTSAGLFRVDGGFHVVAHLSHHADEPDSLPDDRIQALLRDRFGVLWVGGAGGLWRNFPGRAGFAAVPLPNTAGETPKIGCLTEDSAGRIWIGTLDHGAYVMAPGESGAARQVPDSASAGGSVDAVSAATEIRPGEIWLGTADDGILAVDEATLRATRMRHEAALPDSLLNGAVQAVLRDRTGLVWVATNHGVTRADPEQRGVVTVFGDHGREAGLTSADILSVLASPSGMVWAGSRRAGIDILDPAGARIGRVGADSSQQSATLPPSNIHAMVAMPDGAVIAGTGKGLYRIGTDGAVRHLAVPGLGQTDAVRALRLIGGVLWVGGPDGAWALRPDANDAEGGMQVLRRVAGDALSHPRVRCLVPGPDGAVWVGTPHGLNLVPPAPAPIEMIMAEPGNPASLSSSTIITMVTDRQGRLWVGTLDRGLNLMTGRDQAGHPVFRRFGLAQGVPNDSIDALILDRHGTIWASTDGGIIAVDPDTLAVRAYGAAEGVAIPGYFSGAADVGPDGDLVFGGMGGLTIVRPDLLGRPATHPPLLATEIRVGGRIVQPDGKPLRVTPKANSLSVQFASLDFTAPERLRYAYRLDGYDRDWVEVDAAHRLAAYTNLPPGQYVLNLRGSNRDGDWTGMPVRLPVRVLPAWHQTWWCHVVELMASGLAIAGLLQTRTAWIRGRQHELERQVAERTAELLQSQARLHEAAYGDLLTGLANRRAFTEHFRGMAAPPSGEPGRFILLLIDLDGFKQVNDTLGHDVGDAVLLAAANRVRQSVREADFVARLGGDEFAVLLGAPADPDLPGQMCERLIEAMSMPVSVNGVTARIGASVGAAVFPDHGSSQELLYKSADLALYDAKRAGRGVARWFSAWPGAEMAYREGALPAA